MRFGVVAAGSLLLFHAAALARSELIEDGVPPVEHASYHQLVFANDDLAVLNNLYPPGGDSGFHAHHRDLIAVVIQSVSTTAQNRGQPLTVTPALPVGTTVYSSTDAGRRVHRIVNGDAGISQYIVVEIRRPVPLGTAVSSREHAPQYVQLFDNARLRAWRLILEPGQTVAAITQGGNGVRVVVRGGLLTTSAPGLPDQALALHSGDFALQYSGTIRALRNDGTETIELVELELK